MKKITYILLLFLTTTTIVAQTGEYKAGVGSLKDRTLGDYNVAVGDSTLTKVTSSSNNTVLGFGSGKKTTGSDALFLGFKAGYNNTTGADNTFLGFLAGYHNTYSSDNTFGNGAGFNNIGGNDNTFIGESSGISNTSGDDNTFVGHKAGAGVAFSSASASSGIVNGPTGNATGSDNTAVGSSALISLTTGYRNTVMGNEAGYDIKTGYYNTFVGDSTGTDVSSGKYNTFIGQAAGAATEYTSGNTFVGYRAGWDNNRTSQNNLVNAKENTYLGYRAGHKNREGSDNIMIGSRADFTSTYNNTQNIGLGYEVRIGSGNTAKSNAIAIGAYSKVTANNATAIGYRSKATLANTIILGADGTSSPKVTVGIGTKAPNTKATLDLADTDKGFLVNRLDNTQRSTLGSTLVAIDAGMLVYDTDDKVLYSWNGTSWSSSTTDALETRVTALETAAKASTLDKTPQKFNYQTAILDINGEPVLNQNVSFKISILEATATGTAVYVETQSITTTNKGLTNFKIGDGTLVSGDFTTINWAENTYFLKVEADVAGGTTYIDFGTTQLVSVPYALHAKTADKLTGGLTGALVSKTATTSKGNSAEIETLKSELESLKATVLNLQRLLESKK